MNENKVEVFTNAEFGSVRTLTIDGEPHFVGKDVAEILGYSNTRDALTRHVDNEDKTTVVIPDGGSNYKSNAVVINESGLYSLILSSKLPNAKKFKRWVTSEVLPSIRKTGSYNSPDYSALSPQLQFMIQMEQRQNAIETAVQTTNRRIDAMCETMQIRGDNWRTATHSLVNRIATASRQEQRAIYLDIYDELEYRAGCNLSIRLENLRDRLYARGVSQSKIDHLNRIDVIADDKKLTEIYIAIVKEMAVKFDVC